VSHLTQFYHCFPSRRLLYVSHLTQFLNLGQLSSVLLRADCQSPAGSFPPSAPSNRERLDIKIFARHSHSFR
jgi:hypothetical protein